jgi:hypothetical protein
VNSDMIWQLLRYGLLAVGGYFTNKGVVTGDQVTQLVAAGGTIFTAIWGIYVKFNTKAVPASVANKPTIPTVSAGTGAIDSGPGSK